MLETVVEDLSRIPNARILTTWDMRLGPVPFSQRNVRAVPVASPDREPTVFLELAREADCGLIIAPETDGILSMRCRRFLETGTATLNASPAAIDLCADKLTLAILCQRHGIPTIPTYSVGDLSVRDVSPPLVLKPRDGAGSEWMRLIHSRTELQAGIADVDPSRFIVQPFIPGRSVSVAGIFEHGSLRHLFPVAEQRLSADGTFTYLGGQIPYDVEQEREIARIVEQAAVMVGGGTRGRGEEGQRGGGEEGERGTIRLRDGGEEVTCGVGDHGLHGYIGFDFLIPETTPNVINLESLRKQWQNHNLLCRHPHPGPLPSSERENSERLSQTIPPLPSAQTLLVEINPRLTTSYVGYRRLCRENLGAWLIPGLGRFPMSPSPSEGEGRGEGDASPADSREAHRPAPRFAGSVQFLANGTMITHH
jgi:predicted ATP-grasp superfamily ATP-dependent carboligase